MKLGGMRLLGLDGRGLDDGVQVGPHRHLVNAVVRSFTLAAGDDAPDLRDDPPERADVLQRVVCVLAPHPLANQGGAEAERFPSGDVPLAVVQEELIGATTKF